MGAFIFQFLVKRQLLVSDNTNLDFQKLTAPKDSWSQTKLIFSFTAQIKGGLFNDYYVASISICERQVQIQPNNSNYLCLVFLF
jgi:hypothetical protein